MTLKVMKHLYFIDNRTTYQICQQQATLWENLVLLVKKSDGIH
jgi:hypothetical protein